MKLTPSTFSKQPYGMDAQPPVPSYAFDYQGVELHVFKRKRDWIVGEPTTGLVINLYITCTTRKQCLDETIKFIGSRGGVDLIHRAIRSNQRPS